MDMEFSKKVFLGLAIVTILLTGIGTSVALAKVTDPSNPAFNPDHFNFSDYKDRNELIAVYKKLFPVGTPKETVDRVLVTAGKARCGQDQTYKNLWICQQPRSFKNWDVGPNFLLIYDDEMKLLNINPNGLGDIYPNSTTRKDLKQNR